MSTFEEKLQTLRNRFRQSLSERLSAIESALRSIAGGDRMALRELERHLHSLAGTAGTYDFAGLSERAAQGELMCERLGDSETLPAGVFDDLLVLLREAQRTAQPTLVLTPALPPVRPGSAYRVLCVEDDPGQGAFLDAVLGEAGYDVATVADGVAFDDAVASFRPDLILLDINLGDDCGLDLARDVRRQESLATLPIVFVTGKGSLESQLDGIRAGGDDYLVKPVAPDLLLATVASRLERAQAVKRLIDRDALTRLCNAGAFTRRMEQAIDEHVRAGAQYCLVMLDIDHFKRVNDQHGHVVGDRVLTSFARLLRGGVRDEDVVGRCGGEEFGILLAGMSPEDARCVTRRLLERFASLAHATRRGARFFVTFSAGVAALAGGDDVTSWKQRADDALYAAKRGGRARVAAA